MKFFSKLAVLSFSLCVMVIFSACSNANTLLANLASMGEAFSDPAEAIVGTWSGTLDMNEMINKELAASDEELGEYIKISTFNVDYTLNFDGSKYVFSVDKSSVDKAGVAMLKEVKDGMIPYVEAVFEKYGIEGDIDTYLQDSMGVSLSEYIDEIMTDDMMGSLIEEAFDDTDLEEEGEYTMIDGVLTMDGSAVDYILEDNTLTINDIEDADENLAALFPLIMTK